jgi:hypothetical protein
MSMPFMIISLLTTVQRRQQSFHSSNCVALDGKHVIVEHYDLSGTPRAWRLEELKHKL